MAECEVNGCRFFYQDRGPIDGRRVPVIVFVHGLLWDSSMFEHQIAVLESHYRCIAIDLRGQGKSQVTEAGYGISDQAMDVQQIIEHLGVAQYHFVGLSMGGFIGMRLAAWEPGRVLSLTVIGSSAGPEPMKTQVKCRRLAWVASWLGFAPIASRVMPIMFGATFMKDPMRSKERQHWLDRLKSNSKFGVQRATLGVVEREDYRPRLELIFCPTLIMVGDEDTATPRAKAEEIVAGVKRAELCVIPQAGHSASIEQAELVSSQIRGFLSKLNEAR
ncbi:MAG: alpha/beta fold hydrolase [Rubritalea sp.]|uniref:alpha/beta fold hydrolase n=1 Tax=Rubritalea sp. TaxID=2109375 RepID=UPI00324281D5